MLEFFQKYYPDVLANYDLCRVEPHLLKVTKGTIGSVVGGIAILFHKKLNIKDIYEDPQNTFISITLKTISL